MAAFADPRIDRLLTLDPVNGGNPLTGYSEDLPDIVPEQVAPLTIPLAIFGETVDSSTPGFGQACAPADQNFQTIFDAASAAPLAYAWTMVGANHMDFLSDPEGCGFSCGLCNDSTADFETVQFELRRRAVAFLLAATAQVAPPPLVLTLDNEAVDVQVGP